MPAVIRLFARIPLVVALVTICASSPTRSKSAPQGTGATANVFYPEVRLRKLHLVRPDLIPYPIFYDIYC
jgi:hypothetical protein